MSLERTKALIEQYHIRMHENTDMTRRHRDGGILYSVTLFFQQRQMTVRNYYQGPAFQNGPEIEYVLEGLLSDAAGIENNPGEREWMNEYDRTDPDDYQQVFQQTEKLKRFLGEEYEIFLWET